VSRSKDYLWYPKKLRILCLLPRTGRDPIPGDRADIVSFSIRFERHEFNFPGSVPGSLKQETVGEATARDFCDVTASAKENTPSAQDLRARLAHFCLKFLSIV
jgi:hypothetical protein